MRHFRLSVFLTTILLALAGSAFADTVSMNFIGPGGNNSGGVYTYPYNFSVNGSAPMALICDTFDNDVISGETWKATETSLISGSQTGGGGLFAGQTLQYKAAGLIFEGIVNGTINANEGNWAIWGLFSSNAQSNAEFLSDGALGLDIQYLLAAAFTPDSALSNLVLYTPVAGSQSWGGLPQEYIGIKVPEPAEITLMLMLAIGGVLGFAFRQRLGLRLAVAQQAYRAGRWRRQSDKNNSEELCMAINLRPLDDRLVVRPLTRDEVTKSGIVLPDTAKEKPQQADVLAVGPGRTLDSGEKLSMELKSGDRVLFAKYSGTEFKNEGDELLILRESDVLAVVENRQ